MISRIQHGRSTFLPSRISFTKSDEDPILAANYQQHNATNERHCSRDWRNLDVMCLRESRERPPDVDKSFSRVV
jgi:hypothetical protein